MRVSAASYATQAFDAYARSASQRLEEQRAERAVERARAATETARVRKTTIGFSLGKFGIDFTSQNVELDTDRLSREAQGRAPQRETSSRAFESHLEAAEILSTAEQSSTTRKADSAAPDTSALTRRKALEAYAEASLNFETVVPGRLGSI